MNEKQPPSQVYVPPEIPPEFGKNIFAWKLSLVELSENLLRTLPISKLTEKVVALYKDENVLVAEILEYVAMERPQDFPEIFKSVFIQEIDFNKAKDLLIDTDDLYTKFHFSESLDLDQTDGIGPEHSVTGAIQKAFTTVLEDNRGSYLLHSQVKEEIQNLAEPTPFNPNQSHEGSGRESRFLKISKDRYAYLEGEKILLSAPNLDKKTVSKIEEIEHKVSLLGYDLAELDKYRELDSEARVFFTEPLTIESLAYVVPGTKLRDAQETSSLLSAYKYIRSESMMSRIQEDFGIEITELLLKEQFYFLTFLQTKSVEDMKKVQEFSKRYGIDGVRTFLATEHDDSVGDRIVDRSLTLPAEVGKTILSRYGSIIESSERIDAILNVDLNNEDKGNVAYKIRERAKDFLLSFLDNSRSASLEELIKKLDNVRAEALILATTFRTLKESGQITRIDELREVEFESLSGSEVSAREDLLTSLKALYRENYKDEPERSEELLALFEENLKKPGAEVTTLRFKEEVLGSILVNVTNAEGKRAYVSALNTNKDNDLKSSDAGRILIEKTLERYGDEGWTLEASADERLAALYERIYGFKKVKEIEPTSSGKKRFLLERKPKKTTP